MKLNLDILSASTVCDGQWLDCRPYRFPATIVVSNIESGGQVQVWTSNHDLPHLGAPVTGDGAILQFGDISSDTTFPITAPFRWIKATKSVAGTAPQLSVVAICFAGLDKEDREC